MSQITKLVPDFVPAGQSYQVFTEVDGGAGDILMIKDSLRGRPAAHINIEATAAVTVKFNVVHTLFPRRTRAEGFAENGDLNLALGQEYIASSETTDYVLGVGESLSLDNEIAVSDIMIVSGGSDYTILVS